MKRLAWPGGTAAGAGAALWAMGLCMLCPGWAPAAEGSAPAPPEAARQAAMEKLKDALAPPAAKASPEDCRAQARRLFDLQAAPDTEDAARYVLLQAAADRAVRGEDAEIMQTALKALAARLEGDWLGQRIALLKKIGVAVRWQGRLDDVVRLCVDTIAEARSAGRFDAALGLADALAGWGKPLGDATLGRLAARLRAELVATREMYTAFGEAEGTLKASPDAPQACAAAGRYLAFCTDRWAEGLALLTKSNDAALKDLAARDAKAAASSEAGLEAAAAWAAQAAKQGDPVRRRCMRRAGECYDQAIKAMDEPARAAAEKRTMSLRLAILSDRMNDFNEWEITKGQWTATPSGRLLGSGDTYLRFRHKLPGTVFVEFRMNVLDGMRPRIHFEETKMFIGNEGFERKLWPHEAEHVRGLHELYLSGREKRVGVYIEGGKFRWFADGRPTGCGELKRVSDQITVALRAGDDWSRGRTLYWDFRVLAAPPADMAVEPIRDVREDREGEQEVGQ